MACPIKAFERYLCRDRDCRRRSFVRNYSYRGYLPEVKQQIADISVNGSGIRDTACILKISPTTVIEALKKTSTSKSCKPSPTRPNESSTDPSSAVTGAGKRSSIRSNVELCATLSSNNAGYGKQLTMLLQRYWHMYWVGVRIRHFYN